MTGAEHEWTGRPLDEFARARLFEPLGINNFEWARYIGDTDAGGGLRLRPGDMAKIGQLVLDGGRWNAVAIAAPCSATIHLNRPTPTSGSLSTNKNVLFSLKSIIAPPESICRTPSSTL